MIITKFNNMNVEVNKQYELILAIHAVYLLKHPELRDKFDFIETPNINYMHDLEKLIPIEKYPEMIKYITNFGDCSLPILFAIGMDDFYQVDDRKLRRDFICDYMKYGTIEGFVIELKKLAFDIHWDQFFETYLPFYQELVEKYCKFPDDLDLSDIQRFYRTQPKSYTFIPSVLMNGGFGPADREGNLYYNRGLRYNEEKQVFDVDREYLVECLFHEFSHPIVNSFVDKYLANSEVLDEFYQQALCHNLFDQYRKKKETVMYEYLVRANAYLLTKKYFKDTISAIEDDWVIPHGFTYLPDLVSFTETHLGYYPNYEEFVKRGIPIFMKSCIECSKEKGVS